MAPRHGSRWLAHEATTHERVLPQASGGTGVSRKPETHGSNVVYKRLRERGYKLFAVRRDLSEARRRVASIPTTIYASRCGDIQYRVVGDWPTVLVSHGITGGVDQADRDEDVQEHRRWQRTWRPVFKAVMSG